MKSWANAAAAYIALAISAALIFAVLHFGVDQRQSADIALVAGETKIADCLNFNLLVVEDQETRQLLVALASSAVENSDNPALVDEFKALLADFNDTAKQNCLRLLLEVEAELGLKIHSQRPLTVRP